MKKVVILDEEEMEVLNKNQEVHEVASILKKYLSIFIINHYLDVLVICFMPML